MGTRAIHEDAPNGSQDDDSLDAAFLEAMGENDDDSADDQPEFEAQDEDADDAPDNEDDEGLDEENEGGEDQPDETDEKDEDNAPKKSPRVAEDDDEIAYKVDGEEKRVKVKDIRRLVGQEAALTRKSMETAEIRKSTEAERTYLNDVLKPLHQKAISRWNEYKDISLPLEASRMDPEAYKILEADYKAAYEDALYIDQEVNRLSQVAQMRAQENERLAVMRAHEAIRDENAPTHIPGWSPEVYRGLCDYGVKELGISEQTMDAETNPLVFKLLHLLKDNKAKQIKRVEDKKTAKTAKPAVPVTSRVKVVSPGASKGTDKAAKVSEAVRRSKSGRSSDIDKAFEAIL